MKRHIILCGALLALALCSPFRGLAADAPATPDIPALLGDLKSSSRAAQDAQLISLGGELGARVKALTKTLDGNASVQTQIANALQSLLGKKGADTVQALQKLSDVKLTPEQTKLAKSVRDVGSAYLVQKNFNSLEGSEPEVLQIVKSLRKGDVKNALPAIQQITQNAKLTPDQKSLLTTLAEKYAGGVTGQAGEAVKGLKSLPGLGQ